MTKQTFEIVAESRCKNRIAFLYNNIEVGTEKLHLAKDEAEARFHPVDRTWHYLLKSSTFKVSETLPEGLRNALKVCAYEYKSNLNKAKLTFKFLPAEDPCTWVLTEA